MFGSGSVTNSAQLLQLRIGGTVCLPAVGPFKTSCVDSMPEARVSRTPRSFLTRVGGVHSFGSAAYGLAPLLF
jgi:hypothetical protein